MNNQGMNGNMHMNEYSFMGMHQYWWITIVVIVVVVFILRNQFRKRK